MGVVELHITSNFTFLTGASHPEEYAHRAAEMGLEAFAIADENSVAGIVRAHVALRDLKRIAEERERHVAQFGETGDPLGLSMPHASLGRLTLCISLGFYLQRVWFCPVD